MSDEETEIVYTRRDRVIHYGSLEERERQRLADEGTGASSLSQQAIDAGIAAGNINITEG